VLRGKIGHKERDEKTNKKMQKKKKQLKKNLKKERPNKVHISPNNGGKSY